MVRYLIGLFVLTGLVFGGCSKKPELIESKCSACHGTSVVYAKKRSADDWERVIFGMKGRGMVVTPEEEKAIMEILTKQYGK